MARVDLRNIVSQRTRNIADQARTRAREATGREAEDVRAPAWLKRAAGYLPERTRAVLRDALGPDGRVEKARRMLAQARREREDLRHREAALDLAREDLDRARQALEASRFEARARENEAEKLLARAERAAAEASVERLVRRNEVVFDPGESPRPVREVARLAANIKRFGQLTPVVVRPREDGSYGLVTGYRRMAALAEAGVPHVRVRVVGDLDDATAAALYIAENCLPLGVSSKAVQQLAERVGDRPGFAEVLPLVMADDERVVEELYLDELADEAQRALAEGAAWVAALRPHWDDLEADERRPLEDLVTWFAKVAARLK